MVVERGREMSSQQGPNAGGTRAVDVVSNVKAFSSEEQKLSMELAATQVAAAAKAEVESAYIMALRKPRNEEDARTRIVGRCKNPIFAESAMYSKPVGNTQIKGLSVRFAEEMLRLWGNIKTLQNVIYEDNFKRLIKVTVIDLESNASYSSEVTIQKIVERKNSKGGEVLGERINTYGQKVFIVVATEDEMQQKAGALVSKMRRNNGLMLIPSHIKVEAEEQIKATIKDGVNKDPEAHKRKVVDGFASIGVRAADLEKYLGHSLSSLSPAELQELRDVYNAIKDGEATWADYMKRAEEEKVPEEADGFEAGDASTHTGPGEPLGEQKGKGKKPGKSAEETDREPGEEG